MILSIGDTIVCWIQIAIRFLVSRIDGLVYGLDAEIYDLMLKIASAEIFTTQIIEVMRGRVYQLLALIMTFKLMFSFITYLVNPEQLTDKAKGYTNLIKRIVITLVLIVCVPWGFKILRQVQNIVINEGVIEMLVFGTDTKGQATPGHAFMYTVAKIIISPKTCVNNNCIDNGNAATRKQAVACGFQWDTNYYTGSNAGPLTCGFGAGSNSDYAEALKKATTPKSGGKYDFVAILDLATYRSKDMKFQYTEYKYPFVLSTVLGVAIGYMLILMCIDVAVRSVKLAFYEIISPIPIISLIGFKDGKDSMIYKWYQQVLKTFADLFIRILGLQFSIFFITQLVTGDAFAEQEDFLVTIFLIVGALTFAKKLPDILKSIGIDLGSGPMFSLKKRLDDAGPVGKLSSAAVRAGKGAVAGAAGGLLGNFAGARKAGQSGLWAGAKGFGSGMLKGAAAGVKSKDGHVMKNAFDTAGRSGQYIEKKKDTSFFGRKIAGVQERLGLPTLADKLEARVKANEDYAGFKQRLKNAADFVTDGLDSTTLGAAKQRGYYKGLASTNAEQLAFAQKIDKELHGGVKGIKQFYEDLQHSGNATQEQLTWAREAYEDAQQEAITSGRGTTIKTIKRDVAQFASEHRSELVDINVGAVKQNVSWEVLNKTFNQASDNASNLPSDKEYRKAQANKAYGSVGKKS